MLCYHAMPRPILLLIMLMMVAANVLAGPLILCGHPDAMAHAAAAKSTDARTATVAKAEEAAASMAEKRTPADAASAFLIGALLPTESELPVRIETAASAERVVNDDELSTRRLPPLLRPPLS